MKQEHVSSVIKSVSEVFDAMLNSEAKSGGMVIRNTAISKTCVGASISFLGSAQGVVALWFPTKTAINVAQALTSTRTTIPRELLVDCVVEFIGMIIARSNFRELAATPVKVGPPDAKGKDPNAYDATLEIPFESTMGPFCLEFSLGQQP